MPSGFTTIPEAAIETGYNAAHLRRLAREGKIKTQKVGSTWLVDVAELRERAKTDPADLRLQAMGKRKRAKAK